MYDPHWTASELTQPKEMTATNHQILMSAVFGQPETHLQGPRG